MSGQTVWAVLAGLLVLLLLSYQGASAFLARCGHGELFGTNLERTRCCVFSPLTSTETLIFTFGWLNLPRSLAVWHSSVYRIFGPTLVQQVLCCCSWHISIAGAFNMRWLFLALLSVLAVGVAGRHLRSHDIINGGTALQSEGSTFGRALLEAGTDSLVGPLTGRHCLFTASADPPAAQCLVSENENFRVCMQLSEFVCSSCYPPHCVSRVLCS